ncbi:N-acetylglucosamine kinase [Streptomyces sp. NPDC005808]|uniref:N-acetylglucosamine kinase n=1 Tax=Streptomyces sp. NPDC005808 TaxID=3364734 RepID=UPI0036C886B5
MRPVIAGVDIGGTKTHILLADAVTHTVTDDVTVPSTDWQTRDLHRAADWLIARLRAIADDVELVRIAVGAHGCETPAQSSLLAGALGTALGGIPVTVVNDAELLVPAAGFEHGIGVVAGTGSIAVGRHRDSGVRLSAGGWGWVLGDEGSGSALVREAARALLTQADTGTDLTADPLTKSLLSSYGAADLPELAAAMSWDGGVETWGRHTQAVFNAADEGSALARDVIEEGGNALAGLVTRLAERGARTDTVVFAGGVITGRRRLWTAVTDRLAHDLPGTAPHLLDVPPARGALNLALHGGH